MQVYRYVLERFDAFTRSNTFPNRALIRKFLASAPENLNIPPPILFQYAALAASGKVLKQDAEDPIIDRRKAREVANEGLLPLDQIFSDGNQFNDYILPSDTARRILARQHQKLSQIHEAVKPVLERLAGIRQAINGTGADLGTYRLAAIKKASNQAYKSTLRLFLDTEVFDSVQKIRKDPSATHPKLSKLSGTAWVHIWWECYVHTYRGRWKDRLSLATAWDLTECSSVESYTATTLQSLRFRQYTENIWKPKTPKRAADLQVDSRVVESADIANRRDTWHQVKIPAYDIIDPPGWFVPRDPDALTVVDLKS
jgi:hypothetical protein